MWYCLKAIYTSETFHDSESQECIDDESLYEYTILLFNAKDIKDAQIKATVIAKDNETSYRNYRNEIVKWRLVRIVNIEELGERIESGSEIWRKELTTEELYKIFIEK